MQTLCEIGCKLGVIGCKLGVIGCKLGVKGCKLGVKECKLGVIGCKLGVRHFARQWIVPVSAEIGVYALLYNSGQSAKLHNSYNLINISYTQKSYFSHDTDNLNLT